ncbi:MAG: T9SS type A sorting domain-containing protein [Flavobacteriales bacterium]|nr:T9SS type A sorting domain-containing protein [Flavobacteriales bacterium]
MRTPALAAIALTVLALIAAKPGGPDQGGPKAAGVIDLSALPNYANQPVPGYIQRDNTSSANLITDEGATLGRVLFHDQQLSRTGTVSCGSCHRQQFAFSDTAQASTGVAGTTGRHSMRLVNARFAQETHFFWDERADSLEMQATMPVKDHGEMGFSGTQGDPDIDSLITRLEGLSYYDPLFTAAFGDPDITEDRIQRALAQFVRSIQSFDSKYDAGRASVPNDQAPFPNYTGQENAGKTLFLTAPVFDAQGFRIGGGAGCQACHRAPEFDIDPNSLNNGIINSLGGGLDLTNTRSPSLRDVVGPNGASNGPFFHTGGSSDLIGVIFHYDSMPAASLTPQLDPRLRPAGNIQRLQLTQQEKGQLAAFLRTLSGSNLYVDEKWSDPFLNGQLTVINGTVGIEGTEPVVELLLYPNPVTDRLGISYPATLQGAELVIHDMQGRVVHQGVATGSIDASRFAAGTYILRLGDRFKRFVVR